MFDDQDTQALHAAVLAGDVEKVKNLLESGVSPNLMQNRFSETPLHVICNVSPESDAYALDPPDRLRIIELLWQNGARMNAKGGQRKETALHLAVKSQQVEMVKFLLEHGSLASLYDKDNKTPLHLSAGMTSTADSNIAIVQLLLEHGANFHAQDSRWKTPLIEAVCCDNVDFVQLILEVGAQIDFANKLGLTAIFYACENQKEDMLKLLLQYHANINVQEQRKKSTPLHFAAASGRFYTSDDDQLSKNHSDVIVSLLLRNGADVDVADTDGMTALHIAVCTKDEKLLKVLLEAGAKVDVKDDAGMTPLHSLLWNAHASGCDKGRLERMVKLLLDYNSDVNEQNNELETPFHFALWLGNLTILLEFMRKGADVRNLLYVPDGSAIKRHQTPACNTPETCGDDFAEFFTVLNIVCCLGHVEVLDFLLDMKLDIEGSNIAKNHEVVKSPMYFAVKNGHYEIAKMLLDAGCRVNRFVLHKTTVLHVAVSQMQTALVYLLLEYNSDFQIKDLYQRTPLSCAVEFERTMMQGIIKILVMHLAKRVSQNLSVNEADTKTINSRDWLRAFWLSCEKELTVMKEHILCDNVSVYFILCRSVDSLALCLGNESVRDAFAQEDIQRKYPIYCDMLKMHFDLAAEKKELFDFACDYLDRTFQSVVKTLGYEALPDVVVRKIINCFNVRELKKIKVSIEQGCRMK